MLFFFGILAGVLSTLAFIPYVRDTWARRTQPKRASWFIWSILGTIAFFSQVYEGAGPTLWLAGAQIAGTIVVFVLSISRGVGGVLYAEDRWILIAAALGLIIWAMTDTAVYALFITIAINLMGGWITVTKAYRDPGSETYSTWALSAVASAFAIFSLGTVDWVLLAYPMYLLTINSAIVCAITLGRARAPAI